jgi:4-hydroxybenzoate polyprenyltransferase
MKAYLSLVKFSHTIFALPFALVGFALNFHLESIPADINSRWIIIKLLLVLACMVTARNAAMGFNRYLDSHIDAANPRTAIREIPSGVISKERALVFILLNIGLFITATWFINKLCFLLSPVALLVILGYSYTKRFTYLCHLVLGIGLGLAPIGAYLTVSGTFHILPILLGITVALWVSGFDIIYALQDEEFDRSHQLHSIPARFGKRDALFISKMLHYAAIFLLIYINYSGGFHFLFVIGSLIFILLLRYQQTLVKPDDLSKVNMAFFTTNGIASVLFAVFALSDIFLLSNY